MQLTLNNRWIERLAALPESGMGYQRVVVRLRAGRVLNDVIVLNASILQVPDTTAPFDATDIEQIDLVSK